MIRTCPPSQGSLTALTQFQSFNIYRQTAWGPSSHELPLDGEGPRPWWWRRPPWQARRHCVSEMTYPGLTWKIYGGFLKWWYPTTMGFPTKNDHFGVFWGYHHLRKHPFMKICRVENSILLYSGFAVGAAVSAQDRRGDWDGGSCREGSGRSGHKKRWGFLWKIKYVS